MTYDSERLAEWLREETPAVSATALSTHTVAMTRPAGSTDVAVFPGMNHPEWSVRLYKEEENGSLVVICKDGEADE